MSAFLPFLIMLGVLAAIMREDSVLTIFYLIAGAYFIGRWWSERSLKSVKFEREFQNRVFLGENIPVRLRVHNTGWLPTLWMSLHESLPLDLASPNFFRQIIHLSSHEHRTYDYQLKANKRGLYRLGPLFLRSGDLIGLSEDLERQGSSDTLVVYPRIVPLEKLGLPTRSPFGALRHSLPIFEDPSRVAGKRDYSPGDSLRHVDWKTSAVQQRVLVKKFDPAVSLETILLLDLYAPGYDLRARFFQTELAVVVAASLAAWITSKGQSVGLITNGRDPLNENIEPPGIPARKGQGHLMRCLELLARIQAADTRPLSALISGQASNLPWGATLGLITGHADQAILDGLFQAQRYGLNTALLLVGQQAGLDDLRRATRRFGIALFHIAFEQDLQGWRT